MFDFSWNNILSSNTFNFVIMIIFFVVIIAKMKVGQKLENAKNEIHDKIKNSDKLKELAQEELDKTVKSLENLDEELNEIVKASEKTIASMEEKMHAEISQLVEEAAEKNKKRIHNEEQKAGTQLTGFVSKSSLKVAKQQVITALRDNNQLHRQYISQVIDDLDGLEL